ncbi:glycerol-3-phosphate O-acyltransferase [Guillardia theta CCMP2712]|uniref:Glycerol-3-phosphate O-acyltransferase n=2 Tax=Guillardia theta TaxID=55529 RepID=L1IZM5_GUITC|nr:glycerol-3-phosphate O-acyltransferase [Guillardia theta CCMP2712]EKX41344.1 glycerol-3-phosphate O-acyltransferase [Guillardia theta CCMP2712]|eukprot:XP_005828324.1 glycerol-3-phosphate O-acyltransferase [Guillardia theta CCMP2712]
MASWKVAMAMAMAMAAEAFSPSSLFSAHHANVASFSRAEKSRYSLRAPRMVASPAAKLSTENPFRPAARKIGVQTQLREECQFMLPKDEMPLDKRIEKYVADGELLKSDGDIILNWCQNYKDALSKAPAKVDEDKKFAVDDYFATLTELVRKERKRPHYFDSNNKVTGKHYEPHNYHHSDSQFFNYQAFGIDFTRPLVDWDETKIVGAHNLQKIKAQLEAGENVVFLSNHQSESDTHCIFTLLEDQLGPEYGKIASQIVFMAGERVLRDAIVVPFSRGCNLLTVYSKKHIDSEPELKMAKMGHNQKTLKKLGEMFALGGTCMWFAPSGGRDRRSAETGKVELSPFDPNAIEMVRLVAEGAGALKKTHFYPMALATHNIFPPPATVGGAIGEERRVNWCKLGLAVGDEIEDDSIDPTLDKAAARAAAKQQRAERAVKAYESMKEGYVALGGYEQ